MTLNVRRVVAPKTCIYCGVQVYWVPTEQVFPLFARRGPNGYGSVFRDHVSVSLVRDPAGEFVIDNAIAVRWQAGAVGLRYTRHLCMAVNRAWRALR